MNRVGFASAGAAGDPGDEASLLHQVTAPAPSAAPNPGDHDSAGAQGTLALLSQQQGWDRGQTPAQSVAASTRAVGWCCWCSPGVGASLGFVICLSFWETEEKL